VTGRRVVILAALCGFVPAPASAIVGGAGPAPAGAPHAAVMLTGPTGLCTGVLLATDIVLTAAHCLAGGALKLLEFDAARKPLLTAIRASARHPAFDAKAAERHRVTADVALLRLETPRALAPAELAPPSDAIKVGERFLVAGYGVAVPGDGKSSGTLRAATLIATGQPGSLQFRLVDPAGKGERAGLGACTGDSGAPVFRDVAGTLAVAGVVSWSTGPQLSDGCGGLTGVTPLVRYRAWIVEQMRRWGAAAGQ
jgi:hypothetical protein